MAISSRDAFLKDIAESSYEISVRAYNICNSLELLTVRDLDNFIHKHKDFRNVRNCGYRTNIELLELHRVFFVNAFNTEEISEPDHEHTLKPRESVISEQSFEFLISGEFFTLSIRAKNALLSFLEQKLPNKEFVKTNFIDKQFKARKLRNVGRKTVLEIDDFVQKTIDIYYKAENNQVTTFELATLQLHEIVGFEVKETFYLEKFVAKQFPIIAFCSKYLNEILRLESLEGYVLRNHFQMLDHPYTLDELGKKFDLTRERVRQKREKVFEKATIIFSRISPLIDYSNYESVIKDKTFIKFPEQIEDETLSNEIEEVGITFSAFLFGLIFKNTMFSISPNDKLLRPERIQQYETYSSFKKIEGSYLVSNSLVEKALLLDTLSQVLERVSQRYEEDKVFELDILFKASLKNELEYILAQILDSEFELKVANGGYIIKRTSSKKIFEYAKEALEKLGKPSHISQILAKILEDYPDFDSNSSLSSAMGHHKHLFIFFGRTSTFGLKIWEKEYQNIRGGTIRDIVEEFLNQYDEPCHTSSITAYVNKFRKTEEHSIVNNLKMSVEQRFSFLKDGYVGLVNKKYNEIQNTFTPENVSLDSVLYSIFKKD